ncbi:MAG: hypothetical protein ACO1PI_05960 [Bacteroidota bacterium]
MYLLNEQLQPVNAENLKMEILAEIENQPAVTEAEVEADLAKGYLAGIAVSAKMISRSPDLFEAASKANFSPQLAGSNLWEKVRLHLCRILKKDSTASEIMDAIIEVLSSLIPGGVIIKIVVKKILKYVLDMGYDRLCPIV